MDHAVAKQPHAAVFHTVRTRSFAPQAVGTETSGRRHFSDEEKKDRWAHVVAPVGAEGVVEKREAPGPAPVHSPLDLYATLLSRGKSLEHAFARGKGYIHVVQTSGYNTESATGASVRVSGSGSGSSGPELVLKEGDGVYILGDAGATLNFENVGDRVAEVLLFDVE